MSTLTDKEFETLFKKYFVSLTIYSTKFVKDTETARDIVHKSFMNVWEKRDKIPLDSNVKALLYRIVKNLSLNYIRDSKKNFSGEDFPDIAQDNSEADTDIQASELQAQVVEVVRELPERSREIFLMSRYNDLPNKTIAEKLNISVKTVEAHITSTLKTLKMKLLGTQEKKMLFLIGFLLLCVL